MHAACCFFLKVNDNCVARGNGINGFAARGDGSCLQAGTSCVSSFNTFSGFWVGAGAKMHLGDRCVAISNQRHGFGADQSGSTLQVGTSCLAHSNGWPEYVALGGAQVAAGVGSLDQGGRVEALGAGSCVWRGNAVWVKPKAYGSSLGSQASGSSAVAASKPPALSPPPPPQLSPRTQSERQLPAEQPAKGLQPAAAPSQSECTDPQPAVQPEQRQAACTQQQQQHIPVQLDMPQPESSSGASTQSNTAASSQLQEAASCESLLPAAWWSETESVGTVTTSSHQQQLSEQEQHASGAGADPSTPLLPAAWATLPFDVNNSADDKSSRRLSDATGVMTPVPIPFPIPIPIPVPSPAHQPSISATGAQQLQPLVPSELDSPSTQPANGRTPPPPTSFPTAASFAHLPPHLAFMFGQPAAAAGNPASGWLQPRMSQEASACLGRTHSSSSEPSGPVPLVAAALGSMSLSGGGAARTSISGTATTSLPGPAARHAPASQSMPQLLTPAKSVSDASAAPQAETGPVESLPLELRMLGAYKPGLMSTAAVPAAASLPAPAVASTTAPAQVQRGRLGSKHKAARHECAVCLEPLAPADCAAFEPCGHKECCVKCAAQVVAKFGTCPMCRQKAVGLAQQHAVHAGHAPLSPLLMV